MRIPETPFTCSRSRPRHRGRIETQSTQQAGTPGCRVGCNDRQAFRPDRPGRRFAAHTFPVATATHLLPGALFEQAGGFLVGQCNSSLFKRFRPGMLARHRGHMALAVKRNGFSLRAAILTVGVILENAPRSSADLPERAKRSGVYRRCQKLHQK